MTDVHVTCSAWFCQPSQKIWSTIWILSLTTSFEKWQWLLSDPARHLHLYLFSYQTRSNYSVLRGWNSQCIIFRWDLQYRQTYFLGEDIIWIQGFVSEITVFVVMALFSHSCMSWILISSLTRYLLCQGLAVGSPCWFLTSRKSESKNLSLSPDLQVAARQVWRSSLPYYWLDPTVLWLRDWMLWLSSSPLLSHTLSFSELPTDDK